MIRFVVLSALAALLAGCAVSRWTDALTAQDQTLITQTTQRALETARTGESANWTNPASGNRGTVTPTGTFKNSEGLNCRDYQQTVTVAAATRIGYGTACRHANGVWVDRRSPILRPSTEVAYASDLYTRPRLHFGIGYGHTFGHRHWGVLGHHRFGPYPWYGYPYPYHDPFFDPYYDPFYW
jgi:surface antigen